MRAGIEAGIVDTAWPALLFVLLAIAAPSAVLAQEPVPVDTAARGPEVESLRFEGAESLDEELLEAAIVTRETECKSPLFFLFCALGFGWAQERHDLDRSELPRDVERLELLYEAWGFPDAEVEVAVEPEDEGADEVDVVFRIREGEPIRVASLEIRGLDALDPPVELPRPLPLEVGDPYALPLLDSTQLVIQRAFAERGHPYAELEIGGDIDEPARVVRLEVTIDPGPAAVFGEPVIVVEPPIDEDVVVERLAFRPGDPARPSSLEETERRLYALPIVERVVVEPLGVDTGAAVITPRITVSAGRVQAIQAEGTVSSTECLELAAFWRNRYFLGRPRLFSLGAGVSNLFAAQLDGGFPCTSTADDEDDDDFRELDFFVEADLRQPWPGSPRTAILLSGFYARETSPRVFVRRGYGGVVGLAREFRPELTGAVQYSPQRNELRGADIYFCAVFGVCSAEGLDELTGPTWLSPVELFGIWTPEGPPIVIRPPGAGGRWRRWVRAGVEGAGPFTGSEYDYARTLSEGGLARVIGERAELAGRTRVGLLFGASDVLPPQVRFFSGGVNTVRGVAQNLLGPKILVTSPGRVEELGCTLAPDGCPPGLTVDPDLVSVRPTGGDLVFEANLEGRYWLTNSFQGVVFVDFGLLAPDAFGTAGDGVAADDLATLVTPGIGIRLLTGLGPIRIDLAYDPSSPELIPLLVRDTVTDGIVDLGSVRYAPFTHDRPGFLTELWRRLQLQVAIGQPF